LDWARLTGTISSPSLVGAVGPIGAIPRTARILAHSSNDRNPIAMALNLFSRFMPAEKSFTSQFCEQAACIHDAALELRDMVDQRKITAEQHVASIRLIESRADLVAREIFIGANRTFQAPLDREDILLLAHDLDDVVDLIEDTAKGIQRYGLSAFAPEMHSMVDAVVESGQVLIEAMPHLDWITRDHKIIFALCEKIGQIEETADESFDAGLTRIRVELGRGELDAIGYLDRKEIYELIERVVDKCDDVSNVIQTVTAKHV
jgi:uncharacterized protein